jgi:hypothetical protein
MAFFESTLGGSQGGAHRIRIQVDLLGQEVGNNRSLCRFSAWFERVSPAGGYVYNYNTTSGTVNRNGAVRGANIGGYYSNAVGQRWYLAQNEDHWVNHDGNGNASPYYYADYNPANSPYLTSGWVQGNVGLPNINRFPDVTSFSLTNATDVKFTANVTTDYTCNLLEYSLNGAGWVTAYSGNFTSRSFDVGGALSSNTQYSLRVKVRRADTGFYDESNTLFVTTAEQGRIFNVMGL